MVTRPGLYSLISVLVVGGLGIIYANLEPRYRLADQVPDLEGRFGVGLVDRESARDGGSAHGIYLLLRCSD